MNQNLMNKMKKVVIVLSVFLLSLNFSFAEKILFSANHMAGKAGDSNTTTVLSGNAYIKTDSMEIQADEVELSGDDYRYIKASGKVSGKNLDTNMVFTCDNLDYDRTTKIAELKGNVDLEDKDNDVRAKAQIIVYNQDTDIAILQIKINLLQEDNVCTGSYAVYYKKTQILELSGNAQVKQKDDVFRAQFITLNMDTQDITLGGNVKGTVTDSKPAEEEPVENTPLEENTGEANKSVDVEDSQTTESLETSENSEGSDSTEKEASPAYDPSEELEDLVDYNEES